MEGREVTPTEKAYCCSNYPQTEASIIAKFDLACGAIELFSAIVTISVVASNDVEPTVTTPTHNQGSSSSSTAPNQNNTNDFSKFFYWPREYQLIVLSSVIIGHVLGLALSVLLFVGVKKRKHGYLLIWFILTVINVIVSVVSGITILIFASDKLLLSIVFIVSFLYNWYSLWIVKLLMSEIRGVREGYANPLDDGEIEHANNLVPSSDSFTVDKF